MSVESPSVERADVHVVDHDRYHSKTVALVTGAASDIGRATAVALAVNGLTITALDVDCEGLADTAEKDDEVDAPGSIHELEADLTEDDEAIAAVEEAADLGDLRFDDGMTLTYE